MNSEPAAITPERLLQRLDWHVVRRLDGLLQGDYRSLFYGHGVDFADLREYQPGDDIRHIDWNVTARVNLPHVRQYLEDREIIAWFLLDLSPSMAFGAVDRQKRQVLVEFVATLARLLTRGGNRVGALLYGRSPLRTIPPRSGRIQVLRLINDLLQTPAAAPAAPGAVTDLAPLFTAALNTIKQRALVFVVSDFISVPGWQRPLHLLGRRHETLAIRLTDPREHALPDAGLLVMQDAETGEQLLVDTHDPLFRRQFAALVQQQEADLAAAFRRAGVDALALSTEEDLVRAIVRFATLRQRRSRAPHRA
ncbi:MAG: DUF58 domain-containing protein [Anaerolineales bacterium]|nr:DUF58 domain-containing protein [Anaerolineales bacterium]